MISTGPALQRTQKLLHKAMKLPPYLYTLVLFLVTPFWVVCAENFDTCCESDTIYNSTTSTHVSTKSITNTRALLVGYRLRRFVRHLRTYATEDAFQFQKFDARRMVLDKEFSDISAAHTNLFEMSSRLSRHFRFSKHLYRVMTEASSHMMTAISMNDAYHGLISEVYQLRVLALLMFSFRGIPDHSIKKYSQKVDLLTSRFRAFGQNNEELLASAPLDVLHMVWTQSHSIEHALEILAGKSNTRILD